MTGNPYLVCLGCGGVVHQEYVYTHVAFHQNLGTTADLRRLDVTDDQ